MGTSPQQPGGSVRSPGATSPLKSRPRGRQSQPPAALRRRRLKQLGLCCVVLLLLAVVAAVQPLRGSNDQASVLLVSHGDVAAARDPLSEQQQLRLSHQDAAAGGGAAAADLEQSLKSGTNSQQQTADRKHQVAAAVRAIPPERSQGTKQTQRDPAGPTPQGNSVVPAAAAAADDSIEEIRDAAAAELAACMRTPEPQPALAFSIADFLAARPARLRQEMQRYSRLPQPANSVTLMLTATSDRLQKLDGLCSSWPFPIMVAAYVPIVDTLDTEAATAAVENAKAAVLSSFDRVEALGACQMSLELYSERITAEALPLFPINSLRNQALLMASGDMLFVSNADMLIGRDFVTALQDDVEFKSMRQVVKENVAIVIPAFETNSSEVAHAAAAGGKEEVVRQWKADGSGQLQFFRQERFRGAHNATDYPQWVEAAEVYPINSSTITRFYEPWLIIARKHMGAFDEKYRGYGKNKVQQVQAQIDVHSTRFVVHPRAYMVHRPHEDSPARSQFKEHLSKSNIEVYDMHKRVEKWYWKQVRQGVNFRPIVSAAFRRCRHRLPWWKGFPEPIKSDAVNDGSGAAVV